MNYYKALTSVNIAAIGKVQKDETFWLTQKDAAFNLKAERILEILIPSDCLIFMTEEDVWGYETKSINADQR